MAGRPPVDKQLLRDIFKKVDSHHRGTISVAQLQAALSEGPWPDINQETCRLMIGMFDKTKRGHLKFEEFASLWQYVSEWEVCFTTFDTNKSGGINKNELKIALNQFGYRLSDQTIDLIMLKFDRHGRGAIMFDDFIQSCVILYNLTSAFRMQDTDQDGMIKVKYEKFLSMVYGLQL